MRPAVLATFAVAFLFSCVSSQRDLVERNPPSITNPVPMCHVSCPKRDGARMLWKAQHKCSGDKRWFEDFTAIGEYVLRGADGGIVGAFWIAGVRVDRAASGEWIWQRAENFEKADVELGNCSTVVQKIIALRDVSERGQHPGEDPQGNPEPPR